MKIKSMPQQAFVTIIALIILLTGCSGSVLNNTSMNATDIIAGYQFIIDELIASNGNLTDGIEYLAVDTTNLQGISADEKLLLIQSLDQYNWKVLNTTYAQLESEGLINDLYFENGVLITIKGVRISGSIMTVNASLYRGGLGAQGIDDLEIRIMDGQWNVIKTGVTWVA